jgi:hypothetical protein
MPSSGRFPVSAITSRAAAAAGALLSCLTLAISACSGSTASKTASESRDDPRRDRPERATRLPAAFSCAGEAGNCATARGRILYVEEVDPDGDGDAHFALASPESITLPGITVVDVGPHLRPDPLPGPGDYLSAIGPVYPGSFGQKQIEATAIRFTRRR